MFRSKALADKGLFIVIAAALAAGGAQAVTFTEDAEQAPGSAVSSDYFGGDGNKPVLLEENILPEHATSITIFNIDNAVTPEERHLAAVTIQYRAGNRDVAFRGLQTHLKQFPENLKGWLTAAGWWAAEGDMEGARAAISTAQSLAPGDTRVFAVTGIVALNSGDLAAARAAFDTALELDPRNFVALSASPDALARAGERGAALERFETFGAAYRPVGSALPVYMRWAQLLLDTGQVAKAGEVLSQAERRAKLDPTVAGRWFSLAASVAMAEGKAERAEHLLDQLRQAQAAQGPQGFMFALADWDLNRTPEAAARLETFFDDPEVAFAARMNGGQAYRALGRPFKAIEIFKGGMDGASPEQQFLLGDAMAQAYTSIDAQEEAEALLETLAYSHADMAAGFLIWADYLTQRGNHTGAVAALDAGLVEHSNTAELHYLKGINGFFMGDMSMAKASLRGAVDADPTMARAWISLAKIAHDEVGHGGGGRHAPVLDIYREALKLSPNNPLIHIEMGTIALEEGQPLDAIPHYRTAIEHGRGDPIAKAMLSVVLAEHTGELEEARALASEAVEALPDHVQTQFAMGQVLLLDGQSVRAADYLDAANLARPEHGHSLAYAAEAHFRARNLKAAADRAERALHLMLRPHEMAMARSVLSKIEGDMTLEADVHRISAEGVHEVIGSVTFADGADGLTVISDLSQLPAGMNGFHIHANPSCDPGYVDGVLVAGQAAGPHFGVGTGGGHDHHAAHTAAPTPKEERMAMADTMGEEGGMTTMTDGTPEMAMETHKGHTMAMSDGSKSMETPQGHTVQLDDDIAEGPEMADANSASDGHGDHGGHGAPGGVLPIGDLPHLMVSDAGMPVGDIVAPRLRASFIQNRSVMIHDGLSGPRIACAVLR
ncbi:MAG: tetratricopeptide repeat protein [Pseudomonadota bacterium]